MSEKFTIDRAGYQSKQQQEKNTLQVFFVVFTRPTSPSGICGTLLLPLVLLTTTAKKKTLFAGIHISLRGITGFTNVLSHLKYSRTSNNGDLNVHSGHFLFSLKAVCLYIHSYFKPLYNGHLSTMAKATKPRLNRPK